VAEQGSPPPRSGRLPTAGRHGDPRAPGGRHWGEQAAGDEEYPPWAGPGVTPRWAGQGTRERGVDARPAPVSHGAHAAREEASAPAAMQDDDRDEPEWVPGPGSRSRRAAARRRRSRITWVWGAAALVVVLIVAGVLYVLGGGHQPAPARHDGFVTTLQRGEFKTVPDACTAVSSATLGQYLPGKPRMVAPHSLDGSAQSLCNWTLDAPPVYRVLEVNVQAYSPSGLATGNGSATNAAMDAYRQAMQNLVHPLRATHLPRARVTPLHAQGLGSAAFAALQVVLARGYSTDLETVVARDHNVVVTVIMQGPHGHSGRYQAAPQSVLVSGAIAAATDIVHSLH
jgi:hypothetical protein